MSLGPEVQYPALFGIAVGGRASKEVVLEEQLQCTILGTGPIIDASLRLNVIELKVCVRSTFPQRLPIDLQAV